MAMSSNSLESKTSPHSWHSTYSTSSSRATTRTFGCLQIGSMYERVVGYGVPGFGYGEIVPAVCSVSNQKTQGNPRVHCVLTKSKLQRNALARFYVHETCLSSTYPVSQPAPQTYPALRAAVGVDSRPWPPDVGRIAPSPGTPSRSADRAPWCARLSASPSSVAPYSVPACPGARQSACPFLRWN